MPQVMLYKTGTMITCGPHSLDYIIVEEEAVDEHLVKGWVTHPDDTVLSEQEPEPVAKKKPGPKPKAADNGENKG